MTALRFPNPLRRGDRIAVIAISSGVTPSLQPRLEVALAHLRTRGFDVVEGRSLRKQQRGASAGAADRAAELMQAALDPAIAAILPPWGGELAIELLPLLDFDRLAAVDPKWVLGFSDVSTILLPLTLRAGWATAHGTCLMQMAPGETEPLTAQTLDRLCLPHRAVFTQRASERYQSDEPSWADDPEAVFRLTAPTLCRLLNGGDAEISGRLIGGCLDTIALLAGSQFGDVAGFVRAHRNEGAIIYLENAEQHPTGVVRALTALRINGWFDAAAGILLGRNTGPDVAASGGDLNYEAAVKSVLGDLPCPVLLDADIGHIPPQWLLVNGARAVVRVRGGVVDITQTLA